MVALYPAIIIKHDIILCIPKLFLRLVLVGRKNHFHAFQICKKEEFDVKWVLQFDSTCDESEH